MARCTALGCGRLLTFDEEILQRLTVCSSCRHPATPSYALAASIDNIFSELEEDKPANRQEKEESLDRHMALYPPRGMLNRLDAGVFKHNVLPFLSPNPLSQEAATFGAVCKETRLLPFQGFKIKDKYRLPLRCSSYRATIVNDTNYAVLFNHNDTRWYLFNKDTGVPIEYDAKEKISAIQRISDRYLAIKTRSKDNDTNYYAIWGHQADGSWKLILNFKRDNIKAIEVSVGCLAINCNKKFIIYESNQYGQWHAVVNIPDNHSRLCRDLLTRLSDRRIARLFDFNIQIWDRLSDGTWIASHVIKNRNVVYQRGEDGSSVKMPGIKSLQGISHNSFIFYIPESNYSLPTVFRNRINGNTKLQHGQLKIFTCSDKGRWSQTEVIDKRFGFSPNIIPLANHRSRFLLFEIWPGDLDAMLIYDLVKKTFIKAVSPTKTAHMYRNSNLYLRADGCLLCINSIHIPYVYVDGFLNHMSAVSPLNRTPAVSSPPSEAYMYVLEPQFFSDSLPPPSTEFTQQISECIIC